MCLNCLRKRGFLPNKDMDYFCVLADYTIPPRFHCTYPNTTNDQEIYNLQITIIKHYYLYTKKSFTEVL